MFLYLGSKPQGCMAIKVVQGFIDVGVVSGQNAPTFNPVRSTHPANSQQSTSLLARQSIQLQVQQAARVSTSAANQLLQSEATISAVRKGGLVAKTESQKLEDPQKAQELADSVAEDIRDEKTGVEFAHDGLSGSAAREHFV